MLEDKSKKEFVKTPFVPITQEDIQKLRANYGQPWAPTTDPVALVKLEREEVKKKRTRKKKELEPVIQIQTPADSNEAIGEFESVVLKELNGQLEKALQKGVSICTVTPAKKILKGVAKKNGWGSYPEEELTDYIGRVLKKHKVVSGDAEVSFYYLTEEQKEAFTLQSKVQAYQEFFLDRVKAAIKKTPKINLREFILKDALIFGLALTESESEFVENQLRESGNVEENIAMVEDGNWYRKVKILVWKGN